IFLIGTAWTSSSGASSPSVSRGWVVTAPTPGAFGGPPAQRRLGPLRGNRGKLGELGGDSRGARRRPPAGWRGTWRGSRPPADRPWRPFRGPDRPLTPRPTSRPAPLPGAGRSAPGARGGAGPPAAQQGAPVGLRAAYEPR